jgi:glycerophosphoryl diester phosphodiesterase
MREKSMSPWFRHLHLGSILTLALSAAPAFDARATDNQIQVGPRPYYLVQQLAPGLLKQQLEACANRPLRRTSFSIGHRGAAMQFPEHTKESYEAAARMGAGIVECDVTFTSDRELVCRHSQCDLHTTTNILAIDDLAAKCSEPFTPAAGGKPASARCCTSDLTLAEFRRLQGKMDGANDKATTVADYMKGTPSWRTDAYAATGTLMTHKESIALFKKLGVDMTPELKEASVPMPYQGTFTQELYAQKMIDEYKQAGVAPSRVWPQSFNIGDIYYWIDHEPAFGRQAVALSSVYAASDVQADIAMLPTLRSKGVRIVAPPTWALVTLDNGHIVPSEYARTAKQLGFEIITWTLERSGTLTDGGGWYFQSITDAVHGPGDYYTLLDVLARRVGILGIFSDWPGTVTYYANCFGLK